MERYRIHLNTDGEILKLNRIANQIPDDLKIYVEDLDGMKINARSLLGLFATKDFNGLYLISEADLKYNEIKDLII